MSLQQSILQHRDKLPSCHPASGTQLHSFLTMTPQHASTLLEELSLAVSWTAMLRFT
jgi:hypothetical protein